MGGMDPVVLDNANARTMLTVTQKTVTADVGMGSSADCARRLVPKKDMEKIVIAFVAA